MSCERNSTRVSLTAAVQSGVSATAAKVGNVIGAAAGRAGQVGLAGLNQWAAAVDTVNNQVTRRLSPLSNAVLGAVDRPAVMAAKMLPLVAGALTAFRFRGYLVNGQGRSPVAALAVTPRSGAEVLQSRRVMGQVRQGLAVAGALSTVAGSLTAAATSDKTSKRTLELKNGDKVVARVELQQSASLSRVLNRLDLVGSHRLGQNVVSSEGEVVRAKGALWHYGASVVNTPQGERTLAHVQSLSLPAQHYYFDRRLSAEEVAGVVSGRDKAHRLSGYAGEVHRLESLAPSWSAAKQAMITTRLYHPPTVATWSVRPEGKPA